jgi:hypothetical protein
MLALCVGQKKLISNRSVGSRQQELAIFIRDFDRQAQFYTMSGRWIHRSENAPKFYVPNFVEAHELDDILPYLPGKDVPVELEDRLHTFEQVLPRNIGQPLTQKMSDFWARADAAYQKAAARFDNAHRIMAHAHRYTYATLEEIAEKVLSGFISKVDNGKFSHDVLYALHRSFLRDEIGFRIQSAGSMRSWGEYEINSISEVNSINQVTESVRTYREYRVQGSPALKDHPLVKFVNGARRRIDASRQNREFTPYGVIGPYSGEKQGDGHFRYGHPQEAWKMVDAPFLRFLESWACLGSFPNHSSLNGIGSTILRAINRYGDMPLSKKTAWTALQEMGAIPPWENRAHYELRLPHTGRRLSGGLYSEKLYIEQTQPDLDLKVQKLKSLGYRMDTLEQLRKDWGDLPVYCVDDASANELDDGISVEYTEDPDVFWIHVHTADPAAHIDPHGRVSVEAELLTESIYTPERIINMLPRSFVRDHLSLASGRPCLTFSARMNFSGEVLESKISAGIVRNMVYMTHEIMKEVTTGLNQPKKIVYAVGSDVSEATPTRDMLESHQILGTHKRDLEILEKIRRARFKLLGEKGGRFATAPKPTVSVSFGDAPWKIPTFKDSLQYHGDTTIRLVTEEQATSHLNVAHELDIVACFMLVASEVAARWCHARDIPVPYRVTPSNPNKDPLEYFHKVYKPARDALGIAPAEIQMEYNRLLPAVHPSTTPGPHVPLGMDMMVRCTSPLRRFSDLLTHWQIEAALLEEDRLGRSLVGDPRQDYLPFSKSQVDALLPRLALREKVITKAKHHADRACILQLIVRAWHFKEAQMPSPLTMTIRSVDEHLGLAGGVVEQFSIGAQMRIPEGMKADEIRTDDRFVVEIGEIDVWGRSMFCNYVRRIES